MVGPVRKAEYRRVVLRCEHELWFRRLHAPNPGETVWCVKCQGYTEVPGHDETRATYYPDAEWNCYKVGKVTCRGECVNCGHAYTAAFQPLRTHMEAHHRRRCEPEITLQTVKLPPNSPPPF